MEDQYADFTEIVTWPDIQDYMDKDGFVDNTALINSEHGIELYGSSAYRMDPEWKRRVDEGLIGDADLGYYPSEHEHNYEGSDINIDYGFPYSEED